jgi:phage terminase small subunit
MSNLNPKQIKFIDSYMISGNATESAKLAGYSEKTAQEQGSRLLSNVIIKNEIESRQKQMATKANIDREYILNEYKDLLESCKQEGLDGAGTIKDRSNWAKALAQLTKFLGLDAPEKVDVTSGGAPINFNYIKPKKDDK